MPWKVQPRYLRFDSCGNDGSCRRISGGAGILPLQPIAECHGDYCLDRGFYRLLCCPGGGFTDLDTKRILAYSTISQLGYMMLALGVGSVTASMFHLMTHAFFKAALFRLPGPLCTGSMGRLIFAMGGRMPPASHFCRDDNRRPRDFGIPPFAGFFSKDEILAATAHVSGPLYGMAVLTALLTAFYMGRLLFVAFFGREKQGNMPHEAGPAMCFSMIVLSVLVVVSRPLDIWRILASGYVLSGPV